MFRCISILSIVLAIFSSFVSAQDIAKLDKNFAVEKIGNVDVVFRDALSDPFVLEGFPFRKEGERLRRIPSSVQKDEISGGVYSLANHTAGGVIRFRTDSSCIVIRADIMNKKFGMGHMPMTGSAGVDLFADKDTYIKTVNPNYKGEIPSPLVRSLMKDYNGGMRDYTLYLPLYNGVNSIEIGVLPNAKFEKPTPHKISKPIVFYGSSITQGACATRTSLPYPAMLCRELDAPMINLGFSGNAMGEKRMAELIASLDMAAFVYDYDYNAPTSVHLQKTHEPFFKIIRKAHPNLPIIMLSKISHRSQKNVEIISQTYENAKKSGDKNVWFISGSDLFKDIPFAFLTVDGVHPNDLGFYLMYKNTLPVLKEALKQK